MDPLKKVIYGTAAIFVALFLVFWLVICIKTLSFDATTATPRYEVPEALAVTAGFFATTVATATAGVLGITIEQLKTNLRAAGEDESRPALLAKTLTGRSWLAAGCWIYVAVGVAVLLIWVFKNSSSPDMMKPYAFSAVGWMAGAFGAAFKPS